MSEAFDTPVWHNGKALRKGYTTGSCATAAAKVAALMVLRQHLIHQVSIVTPSGVTLCLNVESPHIEGQQAIAAIRKDGGDDVDATHGMLIFARVTLDDSGVIALQGGEGVGTVTRKGIGLPVGSSAINRTPRQTIESAVREAIGPNRGAQIEIFAPEGEERAQKLTTRGLAFWAVFRLLAPRVSSRQCRKRAGSVRCRWSWKLNARRVWIAWFWCRETTVNVLCANRWASTPVLWSP